MDSGTPRPQDSSHFLDRAWNSLDVLEKCSREDEVNRCSRHRNFLANVRGQGPVYVTVSGQFFRGDIDRNERDSTCRLNGERIDAAASPSEVKYCRAIGQRSNTGCRVIFELVPQRLVRWQMQLALGKSRHSYVEVDDFARHGRDFHVQASPD